MTDKSVSFVPGGTKSIIGLTNSHHLSLINIFRMINLKTSSATLFQSIGWQSYLQWEDKFDMIESSASDFLTWWKVISLLIISILHFNNKTNRKLIRMILRSWQRSQKNKKCKANQRKMILMHRRQKSCLIHGPDSSHTTNECQTMRKQDYWMEKAWKNTCQAEHSHQRHEHEQ
jgi:hypothetical protein